MGLQHVLPFVELLEDKRFCIPAEETAQELIIEAELPEGDEKTTRIRFFVIRVETLHETLCFTADIIFAEDVFSHSPTYLTILQEEELDPLIDLFYSRAALEIPSLPSGTTRDRVMRNMNHTCAMLRNLHRQISDMIFPFSTEVSG